MRKRIVKRWESGRGLLPLLFFPLAILWLECVVKLYCFGSLLDRGLFYTPLFTLPLGLGCTFLCRLFGKKGNRRASLLLMGGLSLWYMTQIVYYTNFKTFLVVDSLTMAGDVVTQFWKIAVLAIFKSLIPLAFAAVPFVLLWIYGGDYVPEKRMPGRGLAALGGAAVALQILAVGITVSSRQGVMSPRSLYRESFVPELSVSTFGVATTLRLDIGQIIFGPIELGEADPTPTPGDGIPTASPSPSPEPTPAPLGANVMELDFEQLMAGETDQTLLEMHTFFSQRTPTMKNEYTGMFQGKNLIFITAEGFWRYAVDPVLTPTLYKLANQGFVFENFYTPLWWKSTTDGEYVACTSLIPSGAYRSFKASGENSMYFCMGNQLGRLGYPTKAYHNHTYTYYNRDISHPNMGYDYMGVGNGLAVTETWPESDLEMMELTIPQTLAGERPFHNYYMTVSGHMNYSFMGNAMSAKHQEAAVAAYPDNSEEFQAYKACNMELDQALEYLLDQLEQAGELENTVICLSGDHYPYGMNPDTWTELAGQELDPDFEIYRSTLILWSGDMEEPVVVEKPCDSLDILPTLSNLFGLEYDSRLLMGQDILSDAPGLVVFSNRSFITEKGRYNAKTDTFTPNEGADASEDYAMQVIADVKDLFTYSVRILETDYYGKIGLTTEKK
jgi:lipoteichoic acid synthase